MSTRSHKEHSHEALTDQHKEAVKAWVPKLRRLLEEEFEAQLDRLGLKRNGEHTRADGMQLPETTARIRQRVEALLARDRIAEGTAERGFDNVKREFAYTILNRLVGLKAMEARALLYLPSPKTPTAIPEQTEVLTPVPSQEYSRYVRDFRAASGSRYKYDGDAEEALFRDALSAAFGHITGEIGVLFDPNHDYACVWPTHSTLTRVIRMINEDLPEDAYRAQRFSRLGLPVLQPRREAASPQQKTRAHHGLPTNLRSSTSSTPRRGSSRALVDNTLGRLWLQMHPSSMLKAQGPPPLPDERPPEFRRRRLPGT